MGFTSFCCIFQIVESESTESKPAKKKTVHNVDWHGIRLLFATGTTLEEISENTKIPIGTLHARSSREGWGKDRERVEALAVEAREKTQALIASMPQRGQNWVHRVAQQTDRAMNIIEQEPIETLADVKKVTGVLDSVDRVARRSYGLDEENAANKTIVNLGFLSDFNPDSHRADANARRSRCNRLDADTAPALPQPTEP